MTEFLESISLFPLVLTLGTYQIGIWCQNKTKHALCNPLLIATILSIAVVAVLGFDLQVYQKGNAGISWLLTPATVCLAVPLYEQLKVLKNHLPAIMVGILAGVAASLFSILLLCRLFRLEDIVTISLLPKSITNAIGVALSTEIGGIAAITTAGIAVTGTFGNIAGAALCRLFRIEHPIAMGVAFGTASHVIGTAKAGELHELSGAVGSFSLTTAGLLTVLCLSFLSQYI